MHRDSKYVFIAVLIALLIMGLTALVAWGATHPLKASNSSAILPSHYQFGHVYNDGHGLLVSVSRPTDDGNGNMYAFATEQNYGHRSYVIDNEQFTVNGKLIYLGEYHFGALWPNHEIALRLNFPTPDNPDSVAISYDGATWGN